MVAIGLHDFRQSQVIQGKEKPFLTKIKKFIFEQGAPQKYC